MEIDLGEKAKVIVKLGTSVYPMEVPTVKKAMDFKKLSEDSGDNEKAFVFIDFIVRLGLPQNVADDLSMPQLIKLAEGLMGGSEKK